jgi:hypothetical protein
MNHDEQMPEPIAPDERDPRIQAALDELRGLVLRRFPEATFTVARGDDPDGIYLTATVDVDDLDEVTDTVVARMVDMQVDEGLPIFVVPDWPLHRVREHLRRMAEQSVEARLASLTL